MSNIKSFMFNHSHNVRILIDDNTNPWFCLIDVCSVLNIINPTHLKNALCEKGVVKSYTHTNGGRQAVNFINEPNLYRVIFRSNKPEAKKFQDWVFNDVLPTIRKTGSYSLQTLPAPVEPQRSILVSDYEYNKISLLVWDIYGYLDTLSKNQTSTNLYNYLRRFLKVSDLRDISKDQLLLALQKLEEIKEEAQVLHREYSRRQINLLLSYTNPARMIKYGY